MITTSVTATAALNGVAGYAIFSNAVDSPPSHADAVVVLGGEHDGREDYGLALARSGLASTVVLSNPYSSSDQVMNRVCHDASVEVLCVRPEPSTTHGEALLTRQLVRERHWTKIVLVTWRYHLPRARLIFRRCLSGVSIAAKAVPRQYVLPVWYWQYLYLYQFGGIVKAMTVDRC
ncbi:YdcF family protein [Mycobacterium paraterrae]|uniref:YdcF family protein n=1 Tax=Mycobacterium paraterrae TaxID=577492 RepID=A0ABY3VQ16_9MYCO|nr:YdcF family protein [Mycobacterium paraterrae]UMB70707.1 YdcF family protein [Mycobacterium paraterrae]